MTPKRIVIIPALFLIFCFLTIVNQPSPARAQEAASAWNKQELNIWNAILAEPADAVIAIHSVPIDAVGEPFLMQLANAWQRSKVDVINVQKLVAYHMASGPASRVDAYDIVTSFRIDKSQDTIRLSKQLRQLYETAGDALDTAVRIEASLKIANEHFLERNAVIMYLLNQKALVNTNRKAALKGLRSIASDPEHVDQLTALLAMSDWFTDEAKEETLTGLRKIASAPAHPKRFKAQNALAEKWPDEDRPKITADQIIGAELKTPDGRAKVKVLCGARDFRQIRKVFLALKEECEKARPKRNFRELSLDEQEQEIMSKTKTPFSYIYAARDLAQLAQRSHRKTKVIEKHEDQLKRAEFAVELASRASEVFDEGVRRDRAGQRSGVPFFTADSLSTHRLHIDSIKILCSARRAVILGKPSEIESVRKAIDEFDETEAKRLLAVTVRGQYGESDTRQLHMWSKYARDHIILARICIGDYEGAIAAFNNLSLSHQSGLSNHDELLRAYSRTGQLSKVLKTYQSEAVDDLRAFENALQQDIKDQQWALSDRLSFNSKGWLSSHCKLVVKALDAYLQANNHSEPETKEMTKLLDISMATVESMMRIFYVVPRRR